MEIRFQRPSFVDTWWAVGQEFESLPLVDPAFNRHNMGALRRLLLRSAALPLSYRRSELQRLAIVDGQRVGYLYARRRGDSLHVDTLGVAPGFRRQGVASALLQNACRYAQEHKLNYLTAAVTPENKPAQELFAGQGFRPHRQFRTRLTGPLPDREAEGFRIEELSPTETLPAFERWKTKALEIGDPWAAELVLDVYLRSGWRGAARHWACYAGDQESGYLRVAGLTGKFEAYLADDKAYWDHPGQIVWLQQALDSYSAEVKEVILETAADRQFEVSQPVWQAAGFNIEPRPRYLLISELDSAES